MFEFIISETIKYWDNTASLMSYFEIEI